LNPPNKEEDDEGVDAVDPKSPPPEEGVEPNRLVDEEAGVFPKILPEEGAGDPNKEGVGAVDVDAKPPTKPTPGADPNVAAAGVALPAIVCTVFCPQVTVMPMPMDVRVYISI
jgi:hypothetical protein